MRKLLHLLMALSLTLMVATGCSDGSASQPNSQAGGVDVDLTRLSSTMIMAEVNNIMENAERYMGKTIRIAGPYHSIYDGTTGKYYHFVLIDACCLGLEFVWNGNHVYPDDYPEYMAPIEITGVFGSYEELGQSYYYIAVDEIFIL